MNAAATPLKFLGAGWFALVMGLCGLALAWLRATPVLGEVAGAVGLVLSLLAAACFALLGLAYLVRAVRYPQALQEDLRHPVRHPMVAAPALSLLLLAALGVNLLGPQPWLTLVWAVGAVAQLAAALWVMARWWQGAATPFWPGVTPLLLLPMVGHVLSPLASVPLGFGFWGLAQFGIGVIMWPLVTALLLVRVGTHGWWPERMLASTFITVVPPSVVGMVALQNGAAAHWVAALWGVAVLFLLWSAQGVRRMLDQPFSMAWWGVSFPLTALTVLTLRLGESQGSLQWPGLALLAVSSLVIAALGLATVKGLREGSLLVPEPVAMIQSASSGP